MKRNQPLSTEVTISSIKGFLVEAAAWFDTTIRVFDRPLGGGLDARRLRHDILLRARERQLASGESARAEEWVAACGMSDSVIVHLFAEHGMKIERPNLGMRKDGRSRSLRFADAPTSGMLGMAVQRWLDARGETFENVFERTDSGRLGKDRAKVMMRHAMYRDLNAQGFACNAIARTCRVGASQVICACRGSTPIQIAARCAATHPKEPA